MWFSPQQLKSLEDEVFDLDEHAKGTLAFSLTEADTKCPECKSALKKFNYRLYDLEIELCDQGHGYWLDDGADTRVLELMKKEESSIDRSFSAEQNFASLVKHLHSHSLIERVRELFR